VTSSGATSDVRKKPNRTQGTGACAGSCRELAVTEGQISIGKRDHDVRRILGETERPLSFESQESPHRQHPAKM
jgi:hypothetical protein